MHYRICLFFLFCITLSVQSPGQSNSDFNSYYQASNLYRKGQFEVKIFNALYTQSSFDGFPNLNSRSSYFSSFGQFLFGTNKNINYGFDVVYKSNIVNDVASASPFDVLRFQNRTDVAILDCVDDIHENKRIGLVQDSLRNSDGMVLNRTIQHGLAHLGAKVKFNPIRKWSKLSLQQTVYAPIDQSVDGAWISYTQLMWDKQLSSQTALYTEVGFWTTVHPDFKVLPLAKAFFSYFPNNRWTLYAMTTVPVEYGLGTKFLIRPNLEIEFLYSHYLPLDFILNHVRPSTYNIGFRYTNW